MTTRVALGGRQSGVLRAVVTDHIRTGEPVGSGTVARRHGLGVSSATIRNDMASLEEMGYLTQPHTSAGRIPTDLGYRFYVDSLPMRPTLPATHRRAIAAFFGHAPPDVEEVLRRTASLLSRVTRYAAVALSPMLARSRVVQAELVPFGSAALLLVVSDTGRVDKRAIDVPSGSGTRDIATVSAALAESVTGLHLVDAGARTRRLARSSGGPTAALLVSIAEAFTDLGAGSEHVFVGGAANIAEERSFARGTISRVFQALEEESAMERFLRRLSTGEGVAVRIGRENTLAAMREASVVVASYLAGGAPAGTVAVIGPTRMQYPTAISAVGVVARRLSNTIETLAG